MPTQKEHLLKATVHWHSDRVRAPREGDRAVFFVDADQVQKDRGVATGRVHTAWTGRLLGHEVIARGRLRSVPWERLVEVTNG